MGYRESEIKRLAEEISKRFKLYFYREVFKVNGENTDSEPLTTVEGFCMEMLNSMDSPTISEFANFIGISSANATDKVNHLIKKGYITKQQCEDDKRKYQLKVTDKYLKYHDISNRRVEALVENVQENFPEEEIDVLLRILRTVSDALDPEYLTRREADS